MPFLANLFSTKVKKSPLNMNILRVLIGQLGGDYLSATKEQQNGFRWSESFRPTSFPGSPLSTTMETLETRLLFGKSVLSFGLLLVQPE